MIEIDLSFTAVTVTGAVMLIAPMVAVIVDIPLDRLVTFPR